MNDGANTLCANDSPDKEGDTSSGHKVGFDRKQMADLLDGEPDGWQRPQPKEEEGYELDRGRAGAWNTVLYATRSWITRNLLSLVRGYFSALRNKLNLRLASHSRCCGSSSTRKSLQSRLERHTRYRPLQLY